ncbi:MAG: hypothetical protein JRJ02_02975 [Deltaproteobacteria bacterium]|nr:hypothetical protein [Deltaproteobacteria bacterium]
MKIESRLAGKILSKYDYGLKKQIQDAAGLSMHNSPIGKSSRKGGLRIKIPLGPPLGKGEDLDSPLF